MSLAAVSLAIKESRNSSKACTPNTLNSLIAQAQAGDEKSRKEVIQGHLYLVAAIAGKAPSSTLSFSERMDEGVCGIHRAIDLFSPVSGRLFKNYAALWIRKFITTLGDRFSLTLSVSPNRVGKLRLYLRGQTDGMPQLDIDKCKAILQMQAPIEITHQPLIGRPLAETLAAVGDAPDVEMMRSEERDLMVKALAILNDDERTAVTRHFSSSKKKASLDVLAAVAIAKMRDFVVKPRIISLIPALAA
jgi:DNA-directed RNA polymerase sigma subunit (sigma70/sigma32)